MATSPAPAAELLTTMLLPYEDRTLPARQTRDGVVDQWRFVDTPAATVATVLAALPESSATGRPNGQPPAGWLTRLAGEVGGRLGGAVLASGGAVRVDAICVPGPAATVVAEQLERSWPGQAQAAVVEGWTAWEATSPSWTGTGVDLLDQEPNLDVYSFWWD